MKNIEFGVENQMRIPVVYGAAAAATIAQLPVGTDVSIHLTVDEVFDNLNTIAVGTNVSATKFLGATAATALGGTQSVVRFTMTEAERAIVVTTATATTTGAATIRISYVLPTSQEVNY